MMSSMSFTVVSTFESRRGKNLMLVVPGTGDRVSPWFPCLKEIEFWTIFLGAWKVFQHHSKVLPAQMLNILFYVLLERGLSKFRDLPQSGKKSLVFSRSTRM